MMRKGCCIRKCVQFQPNNAVATSSSLPFPSDRANSVQGYQINVALFKISIVLPCLAKLDLRSETNFAKLDMSSYKMYTTTVYRFTTTVAKCWTHKIIKLKFSSSVECTFQKTHETESVLKMLYISKTTKLLIWHFLAIEQCFMWCSYMSKSL